MYRSSLERLNDLAYEAAVNLAASSPRADYTTPQLPSVTPSLTDLVPFYHNATGNLSQAALSAILAAGGTGALYNVLSYGATGNGTTNDTVAVQAAITAANGGIVLFPGPYSYLVGGLSVPAGTTLLGSLGATILSTATSPTITLSNGLNTVQSLSFKSNALAGGSIISYNYAGGTQVLASSITGCAFTISTGTVIGINVTGGSSINVIGNSFALTSAAVPGVAIALSAAGGSINVLGNTFASTVASATVPFITNTGVAIGTISGNTITSAQSTNALVNVGGGLVVVGNNCNGFVDATAPGTNTIGLNNSIYGVSAPAVPASTVAATNPFGRPANVRVVGGTCTAYAINGGAAVTANPTGMSFVVLSGSTIAITYSVAPTWVWTPVV